MLSLDTGMDASGDSRTKVTELQNPDRGFDSRRRLHTTTQPTQNIGRARGSEFSVYRGAIYWMARRQLVVSYPEAEVAER